MQYLHVEFFKNVTSMLDSTLPLRWLGPIQVHVARSAGAGQGPLFKAATEQFCCLQVVDLPFTLSPFGVTTYFLTSAHVATCLLSAALKQLQRQVDGPS